MKAVLAAVNAKYIHSNPAIRSLYLYAKELSEYIEPVEYTINQEFDQILGSLYEKKPDIVGFSCYLWNIELVRRLTLELSKLLPDCDIWLGGPEVSFECVRILQENTSVRGIMRGEGELVFHNLLQTYVSGEKDFSSVKGIVYRDGMEIYENPAEQLLDMDELPFLYEELLPCENRIIYYESSRGCPFGCSYCMSSVDKQVRFRSLSLVLPELQHFLDSRVPQVKFVDRTFNIQEKRTEQILAYLLEHDNGVTNFHFEIAADLLTDREIEIMKQMRPGLVQLEIGVQTTNPDTMRAIHRKTDYGDLCRNVTRVQENGNVHCHLDLIAGLPLENLESFKRSFDDVYALQPNQLQLGFLKVLKGAPMQQDADRYGIVYQNHAPYEVLFTRDLSYTDVLRLKGVTQMLEVYYNTGLFPYTLRCLERLHESAYALYEGLWSFYQENGYDQIKHSRISRYTILHEYIWKIAGGQAALLDEVLLFDLYARENLKTRPPFADGMEIYKNATAKWYRQKAPEYKGRDFHIEHLKADMDSIAAGNPLVGSTMVLFDYSRRNPVNGMAEYLILA
jgi:radical SAM superfamily enzyme YgiQ (UPF0313 family)